MQDENGRLGTRFVPELIPASGKPIALFFEPRTRKKESGTIRVGAGEVIAGWDEGLVGVQTGTQVRLDIPSDLAYGPDARGAIIGENEAALVRIWTVSPISGEISYDALQAI